jgi:large subunit ribosomal protein L5
MMKEKYNKEIVPKLKEKFGYKNIFSVPRITKVVVNTGFNPGIKDDKAQKDIAHDLSLITGQMPSARPAKKAIASFKIREKMIVGLAVTLRQQRMYDFLDRLIHIALPRGRDFRGLSTNCIDQNGNFNLGLKEQIIFPEISTESARSIFGLEICIVTTAKNREEGLELFKLLGFPLKLAKTK